MLNITGGSVTFGEQRKLADYEGRKVDVTLTFVAPDNGTVSETDVQSILDMAERRVREKQSGQSVAIPTNATFSSTSGTKAKSDKQKAAEAKTNGQSGAIDVVTPQPADPMGAVNTVAALAPVTLAPAVAPVPNDPLGMSSSPGAATAAQAPTPATVSAFVYAAPTSAVDPLGAPSELFTGTDAEITDVALQNAITAKNEATGGKKMNDIRGKIGAYSTAANKSFTGIPQDKRGAFLLELAQIA